MNVRMLESQAGIKRTSNFEADSIALFRFLGGTGPVLVSIVFRFVNLRKTILEHTEKALSVTGDIIRMRYTNLRIFAFADL